MSIADGESPIATPLSLFLVQLALIVIWCKVLSFLFRYIKQPSVVAEVVTGIVLGKSVFGKIDGYMDTMFPETSLASFSIVANIGLILFMYMVGLEIDIKLMKKNFWVAMGVGLGALVVPFLFGTVSAWVLHKTVADPNVSFGTFLLFLGVALSITAFPVLARILTETKLIHTRIGGISLSAAAVEDVVAWCLLALVVAIARAKNPLDTLWTFLMLIGFSLIMFIPVRIFLNSLAKRRQAGAKMRYNVVMLLLVSIFICAWITEIIGVHAIFGSFLLGVVTPRSNRFAHSMVERIEDLVVVILLPLFFTLSGLRTDIGALNDAQSWGLVFLVITLACVGKIAGAVIASRIAKASWRESFAIGVLMNTKGLVELIVLNVGLDVGVLNTKIFTIFVLMALITTFITTPLVHLIYLRKNPMTDNVEDNQDTFSMLLVAQQIPFVPMLVHISGLFGHIRHSTFAKAIIVQEISDRPSSYFFSEFTNAVAAAPLLQKKERKAQMQAINAQAQGSGVTVETKPFASADLAKDVVSYSLEKKFQAILFAVPFSKKTALQKAPSIMIRFNQSLDIPHLTEQKGPVEKAYNFGLLHGPIENCIRNSPATIGVFLHPKKMTNVSLNRILFVYTGRSYESAALEIIKSIPEESQLKYKVITNVPNLELPPSHVIFTETPVELAFEEEKKEYDLIMLAAAREDDSAFSNELVKNTSLPVLLLYPDFRKAEGKSSVLPMEVTESKSEIHGAVDLP